MTIPKITPYSGGVANPDGSQTQTEFTQNMFDQLSYEAELSTELNNTIDGINDTAIQVDADATSASQSASAAEAAASGLNYQGLWPDTGGIANKGDTYQTQASGTPTGQYFTALQNTTVDPVGDDVNWREVVSVDTVSSYSGLSYPSTEDMINGVPVSARVGEICSDGDRSWERIAVSVPASISDFKELTKTNAERMGFFAGHNITHLIIDFMNSNEDFVLDLDPVEYDVDENLPYYNDGKLIRGVPNKTKFNYVGSAGSAGNPVTVVKLRKPGDNAVSSSEFSGIILDLNNTDYVEGIDTRYFTNESYVGFVKVLNTAANSEALIVDKLYYTHWGPITLRNNPAAKVGKGFVLRPTVSSLASINSHSIPQVEFIGFQHNLYIDTTFAAINTLKIEGSSEAGVNSVTYVGGFGVNEADIRLHMEGNTRNVNWIGDAVAGNGNITWRGVWNNTAGGDVKVGSGNHYFRHKHEGVLDLYKWGGARVAVIGSEVTDHEGESGNENGNPVTYTGVEEVSSFPGWRQSNQLYISATQSKWMKADSGVVRSNTTGFVEFDFSDGIRTVNDEFVVTVDVSYIRPDGSNKSAIIKAWKRSSDTVNCVLNQQGGDAIGGAFDVEVSVSGIVRVKSSVAESILYDAKIIPS